MSFKRLDSDDITISAESVVAPLWSTGEVKLENFETLLSQTTGPSGDFFHEVYEDVPTTTTATTQFAVAYGNSDGLGSNPYTVGATATPTKTIYGQYRTLVYGDENGYFFNNPTDPTPSPDSIYVISIDRAKYKEKLLPGSFKMNIGTGTTLDLIDDSQLVDTVSYCDAGRIYNIIKDGTTDVYGKFLPDVGLIVLNGDMLDTDISLDTDIESPYLTSNITKLVDELNSIELQAEETISSNFVFVRVRNSEFNYSTNPSNISATGELLHGIMINTPQSYITTVGLYNDSNDLIAVAKLSRPLLKDFTKEALVRIKLDY